MFNEFQKRVQHNQQDADALWGLSICYQRGWWGAQENQKLSHYYLIAAANNGSQDALDEIARRQAIKKAQCDRALLDAKQQQVAAETFTQQQGLLKAIATEILPALVSIRIRNGIVGAGFFQHSEWLTSNAHIFPGKALIDFAELCDHQFSTLPLIAEQSYHRPAYREDSPDVVIVKTASRSIHNKKCIPTMFPIADEYHPESYLFYIDLNSNTDNRYEIKFLKQYSKNNTYPIIYECIDGSIPQPGCSGTPIIEARVVIIGNEPKWQFKVNGALYARCAASWYNANSAIRTEYVSEQTKLVCAVPVIHDFNQVLALIHDEELAIRHEQMADACLSLGDAKALEDADRHYHMSQATKASRQLGLCKFENGQSQLDIALPDGLEKLWYQGIVNIADSLLIQKVLLREVGRKNIRKFFNIPSVSVEELAADFDDFLLSIKDSKEIPLGKGDNVALSPAGYFRMDIGISGNNSWMVDIQDNTGKNTRHSGKALSSVFAKVTIPKNQPSVLGDTLAKLLSTSQATMQSVDMAILSVKKQGASKIKHAKK